MKDEGLMTSIITATYNAAATLSANLHWLAQGEVIGKEATD